MIPHLSPWIWITAITTLWIAGGLLALALCKAAGDADEHAARLFADNCPDELEP